MYYEGVTGIILVFDTTDQNSFDNINKYWLPKIIENCDSHIELLLVGNKNDLINERVIDETHAKALIENNLQ